MLTIIPNVGVVALGSIAISLVRSSSRVNTPRRCVQLVVVIGSATLIYLALNNMLFYISGDAAYVSFEIYARAVTSILWFGLIFRVIIGEVKKEAQRRGRELEALNEVACAVGQSLDLDVVLSNALKSVIKIGNFDVGFIYLLNENRNIIELAAAHGNIPDVLARKLSTLNLGQEV